jgi:hypothetical protein
MTYSRYATILLVLACLGLAPPPARAAASYDNCAGFIDSLPATITKQGVWCLRKDLSTAMSSGVAIGIAANNVTIDCNDFKIGGLAAGQGSQTWGVYADGRLNATVRNCSIRGFYAGLVLWGGGGHLVENNRFDNNLLTAIMVRNGSATSNLVQHNRVYDTGGAPSSTSGIEAEADLIENTVTGVFSSAVGGDATGIAAYGPGTEARGNRVRELVPGSGGSARALRARVTRITLVKNRLSNDPAQPGVGVDAYNASDTICIGNTITGFTIPMANCMNVGDNYWW